MLTILLRLAASLVLLASLVLTLLFAARPAHPRPLLSLIRFDRLAQGSSVWLLDRERDRAFRLLSSEYLIYALWSPDGRFLAYTFAAPDGAALFILDMQTGTQRQIANVPDLLPVGWSPDARWLLLSGFSTDRLLYLANDPVTPTEPLYLATGTPDVVWSRDSRRLYLRDQAGTVGWLDVRCLEGIAPCIARPVPAEREVERLAGRMPDGETLMALSGSRASGQPDLFSLDPETGDMELLLEYLLPGAPPVWSPDGEVLAASLALPPSPEQLVWSEPIPGVYLVRPGGEARPQLLWTGIAGQLSWSPDGDRLVFELISRVGNERSVWIYDMAAATLETVTAPGRDEASPAWLTLRGRTFDAAPLLALQAALVLALWVTRRR